MSPLQRQRLLRLIFLLVIAVVLIVGGSQLPGLNLGMGTILPLILLGALLGFFLNRKR